MRVSEPFRHAIGTDITSSGAGLVGGSILACPKAPNHLGCRCCGGLRNGHNRRQTGKCPTMIPNPKQDLRFRGASLMCASFGTPGWALFTLLLLAFAPSGCSISSQFQQNLNVQAHLSAARTAPVGSMTTDSGNKVTALNLDDIGLSESSLSVGIRIQLDHGPLRFLIDRIETSSSSVGFFEGEFGGADLPGDN